jgi:hypothetical protein
VAFSLIYHKLLDQVTKSSLWNLFRLTDRFASIIIGQRFTAWQRSMTDRVVPKDHGDFCTFNARKAEKTRHKRPEVITGASVEP